LQDRDYNRRGGHPHYCTCGACTSRRSTPAQPKLSASEKKRRRKARKAGSAETERLDALWGADAGDPAPANDADAPGTDLVDEATTIIRARPTPPKENRKRRRK
jgi:hypothetical protein